MNQELSWVDWPIVTTADEDAALRVVRSGIWIDGDETKMLENDWAVHLGTSPEQVIAVSSCTNAMLLILDRHTSPHGTVVGPAMTYRGTMSPAVLLGREVEYADIDRETCNISVNDIRNQIASINARKTDGNAIIAVHMHGVPADVSTLMNVISTRATTRTVLIEDCCQAHGSRSNGEPVGTTGDFSVWSLNQTKTMPGGQGGLIWCRDPKDARDLRKHVGAGTMSDPGWSFKITEVCAALARTQLCRLKANAEKHQTSKSHLEAAYNGLTAERETKLFRFQACQRETDSPTWHKIRVMLDPKHQWVREQTGYLEWWREFTRGYMAASGLKTTVWEPETLPSQQGDKDAREKFRNATEVCATSIILGNERHPLAIQKQETIDAYARCLAAFDEEYATFFNEGPKE